MEDTINMVEVYYLFVICDLKKWKPTVCLQKSESSSPPRKSSSSASGKDSPKKKKNVLRRPTRDSDSDSLTSVRSEPNLSARSDSSSSSSSYAKNDVFRKVSFMHSVFMKYIYEKQNIYFCILWYNSMIFNYRRKGRSLEILNEKTIICLSWGMIKHLSIIIQDSLEGSGESINSGRVSGLNKTLYAF